MDSTSENFIMLFKFHRRKNQNNWSKGEQLQQNDRPRDIFIIKLVHIEEKAYPGPNK